MAKEKVLYEETYRKGAAVIKECFLPNLPHVDGRASMVHSGEILKAGRIECADGVKREFQVIRFLLSERPQASDAVDPVGLLGEEGSTRA